MKLTTITILSNDADADSAQRIYQQGAPDAVWQAVQNMLTNPDNVLTFGLAPAAEERCLHTGNPCGTDTWMVGHPCKCVECQLYIAKQELATLRTQLEERNTQLAAMRLILERVAQEVDEKGVYGSVHPRIIEMVANCLNDPASTTAQWLADHDAQVRADFARIVLKRWHNDAPRIELTYDWLSERTRADRLSAPKPEQRQSKL